MASARAAEDESLLAEPSHNEKTAMITQEVEKKVTWRNLPHKKQLLLLALCRLSTPLSNACLLPYLFYLVKSILSDPEHPSAPQEISRLTGLLVAAYPVGQMSTSMLWGRFSDSYGRKPAILMGLAISVVANLCFGFSRTIGMLLFWRILAGMANGMLGVMRTMTAEIVKDRKYQSRAFLAPPVIFNSGRVAALAIGGCLADPNANLPWLFGSSGLFNFNRSSDGVAWTRSFPYALPALFNGMVLGMCFVLAALWLRESLPSKADNQDIGLAIGNFVSHFVRHKILRKANPGYTAIQMEEPEALMDELHTTDRSTSSAIESPSAPQFTNQPSFREIWTRHLLQILFAFTLLPLHNATFLHIFPIFLSMPTSPKSQQTSLIHFTGGLGLASPTVGLYLATFGICGILLQLFIYPRLQRRIGTLGVFRLANAIFPLAYLFAPYLSLLAGREMSKWPAMAVVLFAQVMARTMAIPSSAILLTEAAPRRNVLGTVHGAGNTFSALASAIGPVIGGMLLARGIQMETVGLVWWVWLFVVALVALGWSFVLRNYSSDDIEKGRVEET